MNRIERQKPGPNPRSSNSTILHSDRLVLSFGTDEDAPVLFPYVHGEQGRAVTDYLLWDGPDEPSDLASFFRRHTTGTFVSDGFHWLIRDRHGDITGTKGEAMGSVGINQKGPIGRCEIGYWIAPPFWRKGLMREALRTVLAHGFNNLHIAKLEADVFVHNEASCALLESIGFQREGTIRRTHRKRGQWVDAHVYGLIPSDLSENRD